MLSSVGYAILFLYDIIIINKYTTKILVHLNCKLSSLLCAAVDVIKSFEDLKDVSLLCLILVSNM